VVSGAYGGPLCARALPARTADAASRRVAIFFIFFFLSVISVAKLPQKGCVHDQDGNTHPDVSVSHYETSN
jgi:hypothetical protein